MVVEPALELEPALLAEPLLPKYLLSVLPRQLYLLAQACWLGQQSLHLPHLLPKPS